MRRGMWQRALVGALCVGMAVVASPAAAGRPYKSHWEGTEVVCLGESGDRMVELGGFFTASGELEFGYGGVYTEQSGVWVQSATGSLSGGAFDLAYGFADGMGEPAGTLDMEGTVMPAGEPDVVRERWREGNAQGRVTGTVQDLLVTAEITAATGQLDDLPGTDLTCLGVELDLTEWSTNPATRIYRSAGSSGSCEIGEDGTFGVEVWGEEAYGFLATGIDWDEGTAEFAAEGPLTYTAPTISGELPVVEPADTGQAVIIDVTVGGVIDRTRYKDKSRNGAYLERVVLHEMSGTAILPDGAGLALTDCVFAEYRAMERYSSRAGQKPGGKPPVNDLPADALIIGPADIEKVSTRGAAIPPEAPCVITFDGDEPEIIEVPFGRTVWYAFDGTGDEVTLSTSGTGFDTVMGVYAADGMSQVSCVDDVWGDDSYSLEAEVTVATDLGSSYLVQVGGFGFADEPGGPAWGTLALARS